MWFIDHSCFKINTYPPPHTHTHSLSLSLSLSTCVYIFLLLTGDDGCTPRVLQAPLTMLAATV